MADFCMVLFAIFTILRGVIGGIMLITIALSSMSAPQQAAGAAVAVGLAVIPYCMARAFEMFKNTDSYWNKEEGEQCE